MEIHPQKSKILPLSKGVDFLGFRNFYNFKILRKRNLRNMMKKINSFKRGEISFSKLSESYNGWKAYTKWANAKFLRKKLKKEIIKAILKRI